MASRGLKRQLRHRTGYALTRALEGAALLLPEPVMERVGAAAGALVSEALGLRRKVVEENLRAAFPDKDQAWVRRTVREVYRNSGREGAILPRLSALSREELLARTEVVGWEQLERGLAEGRGVIVVSGHYGNWEMGAAGIAARGIPFQAVVRRQNDPLFDDRLDALRERMGVGTISSGEAVRRVPRILRENGVVGVVADQDAGRAGVRIDFLNRPASAHRGAAVFALRSGAAVIDLVAARLPGSPARYRLVFNRVPVRPGGDTEEDVRLLTQEIADRLARAVRDEPVQYFWFHRRWKSFPSEPLGRPGSTNRGQAGPADP
ncbi:MAG: lysophospholipid acyltransferase family protein [Longimicrobiaceae bacterium]